MKQLFKKIVKNHRVRACVVLLVLWSVVFCVLVRTYHFHQMRQRLELQVLENEIDRIIQEVMEDELLSTEEPMDAEHGAAISSEKVVISSPKEGPLPVDRSLPLEASVAPVTLTEQEEPFPLEGPPIVRRAVHPVRLIPNWGVMRTSVEWDRAFDEMTEEDFVPIPPYDLSVLTIPMKELTSSRMKESIAKITTKLYYSTRHFGAYDLDSGEFEAIHPGVDLKLPLGTPIGSVATGRVHAVRRDGDLGLHLVIEHRLLDGEKVYSVYAHLDTVAVEEEELVRAGEFIATVGASGNAEHPHLHLQVDRDRGGQKHVPYWPESLPSRQEAEQHTINPVEFIALY